MEAFDLPLRSFFIIIYEGISFHGNYNENMYAAGVDGQCNSQDDVHLNAGQPVGQFYDPKEIGAEKNLKEYLNWLKK